MYSISDMIMFKRGELEFPLPQGVQRPAIVVAEQTVEEQTPVIVKEEKQETGIKRLFKTLRKKEKK